ncbi:MAG: hypothetical protein ACI4P5_09750 [Candidatus Fimadaptatus sp.]
MRRIIAVAMAIVLGIFVASSGAMAEAQVTIMPEAANIPEEVLRDIISSNPGSAITIHDWEGTNNDKIDIP